MLVKKETLLSMQQTENKAPKNNGKPYYDGRSGKWKLDIPGFGTEKGDLAYIACEFVRTSLYYPFYYGEPPQEGEFEAHSHSFQVSYNICCRIQRISHWKGMKNTTRRRRLN